MPVHSCAVRAAELARRQRGKMPGFEVFHFDSQPDLGRDRISPGSLPAGSDDTQRAYPVDINRRVVWSKHLERPPQRLPLDRGPPRCPGARAAHRCPRPRAPRTFRSQWRLRKVQAARCGFAVPGALASCHSVHRCASPAPAEVRRELRLLHGQRHAKRPASSTERLRFRSAWQTDVRTGSTEFSAQFSIDDGRTQRTACVSLGIQRRYTAPNLRSPTGTNVSLTRFPKEPLTAS